MIFVMINIRDVLFFIGIPPGFSIIWKPTISCNKPVTSTKFLYKNLFRLSFESLVTIAH